MNEDIRLSVDFWDHHKTARLKRRLGPAGPEHLQRLWCYTANNRIDGILTGMDEEDIAIAAKFEADAVEFVKILTEIGWLDFREDLGCWEVHEWLDHNPWVAKSGDRKDSARLSRLAATHPDLYAGLKEQGITAITKEDYERLTRVKRNVNGPSTKRQRTLTKVLTPTPAPAPTPAPTPSPTHNVVDTDCSEPAEGNGSKPAPRVSPVLTIPLIGKHQEHPVYQHDIDEWQALFAAVEVTSCLKRIEHYFRAEKPEKRKTAKGIVRCLTAWLSREQDRGGGTFKRAPPGSVQPGEFDERAWIEQAEKNCVP